MGRHHPAVYWQTHVERWQASGLSQAAYCRTQALTLRTFRHWITRVRAPSSGHTQRPAPVRASAPTHPPVTDRATTADAPTLTLVAAHLPWAGMPEATGAVAADVATAVAGTSDRSLTIETPDGWQLHFAQMPPAGWLRMLIQGSGQ